MTALLEIKQLGLDYADSVEKVMIEHLLKGQNRFARSFQHVLKGQNKSEKCFVLQAARLYRRKAFHPY